MDDERVDDEPGDGTPPGASAGERSSRLTTTIPRPATRRASDAGRSRLSMQRAGPDGDRISTRRSAWLFGLAALVVAGAVAAALFGLPVRTWFDQNDQIRALEHEVNEIQEVNDDLQGEVDRLQTEDGIREAAREELGQVQAGDQRITLLEAPDLPRDLPAGWPYAHVDQILTMHETDAATAAAAGTIPTGDDDAGDGGGFEPVAPTAPPSTAAATSSAATSSVAPTSVAPTTSPPTTSVAPTTGP